MNLWTRLRLAVLYGLIYCMRALTWLLRRRPHWHRFEPRVGWADQWGRTGLCRCGLAKRRMVGGYGYAYRDGLWLDSPGAAARERGGR